VAIRASAGAGRAALGGWGRHGYADEDRRIMSAVARHVLEIATGVAGTGNVVKLR